MYTYASTRYRYYVGLYDFCEFNTCNVHEWVLIKYLILRKNQLIDYFWFPLKRHKISNEIERSLLMQEAYGRVLN